MRMKSGLVAAALVWIAAVGAVATEEQYASRRTADKNAPTFSTDVAPIIFKNCAGCHRPGEIAPMSLLTYEDARPWASAMREEVLARRMPKWHAARGYGQFANDPTLSPFDIALIVAWVDGGAVRGDASKIPARPPAAAAPTAPPNSRTVTIPCADRSLPSGTLLGIRPRLSEGASAGFTVVFPDGREEIVAWIRDYEAEFAETYWLETPMVLTRGSRLRVDGDPGCRVTLVIVDWKDFPPPPRSRGFHL